MIVIKIIFFVALFALLYNYLVYPLYLSIMAKNKQLNLPFYAKDDEDLPHIFILMAVYNEEKVISQKIDSIFLTNYPTQKIKVLIGSDNSTDNTDHLIKTHQQKENIELLNFEGRNGKPNIINKLVNHFNKSYTGQLKNTVFILTDANVIFSENTIYELVKYFKNKFTGIVGADIKNNNILPSKGIGFLEHFYVSNENNTRKNESILYGKAMGVFGGCYAIKSNLYKQVPPFFLVDDFFISMKVIEAKKMVLQNAKAIAYEDIPNSIAEEFRRKRRIGAGNFQNLLHFKKLWLAKFNNTTFVFISHKLLRWLGPFFLIATFVCAAALSNVHFFYKMAFITQVLFIAITFIYLFFKDVLTMPKGFKIIAYFYSMNSALMMGFFDFMKGIKSGIWEPTKRNITT